MKDNELSKYAHKKECVFSLDLVNLNSKVILRKVSYQDLLLLDTILITQDTEIKLFDGR